MIAGQIHTFMSATKETDVTELFKGYTTLHILDTYGQFYLMEDGSDAFPILKEGMQYDITKVTKIGYDISPYRKSLPTFHYRLSR